MKVFLLDMRKFIEKGNGEISSFKNPKQQTFLSFCRNMWDVFIGVRKNFPD
jgi:hypothetical protein